MAVFRTTDRKKAAEQAAALTAITAQAKSQSDTASPPAVPLIARAEPLEDADPWAAVADAKRDRRLFDKVEVSNALSEHW